MLEQLTYDLCQLIDRSTRAVSLFPPVYYADLACERARRYLAKCLSGSESGRTEDEMTDWQREQLRAKLQAEIEIHGNLKDTIFYI